ncbi:MAG: PAS domain S-box protein [Myxococcota bacterium]
MARGEEQAGVPAGSTSDAWLARLAYDLEDVALVVETTEGRISRWSRGAERLFGWSAEEAMERGTEILAPVSGEACVAREHDQAERAGRAAAAHWFRRRDGSRFLGDERVVALRDVDGRLEGFGTTIRDITADSTAGPRTGRKRAKLALLLEVACTANESVDVDQALDHAVRAFCEHMAWPVGHAWLPGEDGSFRSSDIWQVADEDRFGEVVERSEGATVRPGEGPIGAVMASGTPTWFHDVEADPRFRAPWQGEPLRSGFAVPVLVGREVVAVLEFLSEEPLEPDRGLLALAANVGLQLGRVVERARVGDAMREQRDFYQRLLDCLPVLVWQTNDTGARCFVNAEWRAFTGQERDEALHDDGATIVDPADRDRRWRTWKQAWERREPYAVEIRLLHRSGTYRPVLEIGRPLYEGDGTFRGYVGGCIDLSEREQLEEALRRAQRMEALDRFAGGVAHDFNNLLTVVVGHAELLREALPDSGPAPAHVRVISDAAKRATSLTEQLLAFSRTRSMHRRVLAPNTVIRGHEEILRGLLGETISLELDLSESCPPVLADEGHLAQVLLNLVINARDALPEGGRVRLSTGFALDAPTEAPFQTAEHQGAWARLTVEDDGCGMEEHVRRHMFEPFFTTKGRERGTGLGLATVYGIVAQSGGRIRVRTRPGQGTRVDVYLPEASGPVWSEKPPDKRTPEGPGGRTVLVAEDQAPVRTLVRHVLEHRGYLVLEAGDGVEALQIAEAHEGPIDLLLTDVVMPRMGGIELARRLADARPKTGLLFMSGYPADALKQHRVDASELRLLAKPFTPSDLLQAVQEAMDNVPATA